MEKSKLDGFIKRYNLNNCVESVKVTSSTTDNSLKTRFISEEKHVIGTVSVKGDNIGDCEIGVFDTAKLKQLLGVLGNEITIDSYTHDERVVSLTLTDNVTKVNYMLADLSVIPKVPNMVNLPTWEVVIHLNKEFMARFIKAKNALPEVNTFTLLMNKKTNKLELVIGYSAINSNRISLDVSAEDKKDTVDKPISFSAKYFKEILSANSDSTDAVLNISTKGLAFIEFSNKDYSTEYYLTAVDVAD